MFYEWGVGMGFRIWDIEVEDGSFFVEVVFDWRVSCFDESVDGFLFLFIFEDYLEVIVCDVKIGEMLMFILYLGIVNFVWFDVMGWKIFIVCDDNWVCVFDVKIGVCDCVEFKYDCFLFDVIYFLDLSFIVMFVSD